MSGVVHNNIGNMDSSYQFMESPVDKKEPKLVEQHKLAEQMIHQANELLKKMENMPGFSTYKVLELTKRHENGTLHNEQIEQSISILKNMDELTEKIKDFENKETNQPFPYNYCATVGKNVAKLWMDYNASWLGLDQDAYKAQLQECKSDLAQARHMVSVGTKMYEQRQKNAIAAFEAEQAQKNAQNHKKVCIIPGGTGEIGKECTQEALKRGEDVVVISRNPEKCQNTEHLHYVKGSDEEQCSKEY